MMQGYNRPAIALHWLVAVLICCSFPLGLYMTSLALSPLKLQLYSYHKWLGMLILALVVLRVLWRLGKGAPPALPAPAWQQRAAVVTHTLLYALMVAIPLTGWMMSSAKGFPVVWLGVLPLPDLVGKDEALGDLLLATHKALNFLLLGLVGLHVAAALKHHFVDRDATLVRMLPLLRRGQ